MGLDTSECLGTRGKTIRATRQPLALLDQRDLGWTERGRSDASPLQRP